MIERKIIIGLITSTDYLKKIRSVWDGMLLESSTARIIAGWCIDHFDKYQKAPNKELETIFFQRAEEGLDKEIAEEIEENILPSLSEEFVDNDFDLDFLVKESISYLKSRQLLLLSQQIDNLLDSGQGSFEERLKQAEQLREEFKPINIDGDDSLDLSNEKTLRAVRRAFTKALIPIIKFPKQLGKFWNHQLVAGGFVALLGIEKRGKTFLLLELGIKAARQGNEVAMFQAGDMNEAEQLRRVGVYLTKRSNMKEYCEEHYQPVRDCIRNQTDECNKNERECDFTPFEDSNEKEIKELTQNDLIEAYKNEVDYKPCFNCDDYDDYKLGVPWIKKVRKVEPIGWKEAQQAIKEFFQKYKRRFKLSTHPNGTLTFSKINNILDAWENEDDFVPKVILIDYIDIMDAGITGDKREKENKKWMDARKLSQTKRGGVLPLVISVTQADAPAYNVHSLKLENFSEDKRKYGHVTAMYGMNQSPDGREKEIGLMRINELVIREGASNIKNEITVLQNLRQGRPFTASYF